MRSSTQRETQCRTEARRPEVAFSLPISDEISVVHAPAIGEGKTEHMAKGLFLSHRGQVLAGESSGFGLPVLRTRCRAYFPSLVSARPIDRTRFEMVFQLDLEERLRILGIKIPKVFGWFVTVLLHVYMSMPRCQRYLLKFGEVVRSLFRVRTSLVPGVNQGRCRVIYKTGEGVLSITVDASPLRARTQLILLNEVAGLPFDRVRIGERVWEGAQIPGWKIVPFGAALESRSVGCGFGLCAPDDGVCAWRLACGREVARNLNWAGFALTTNRSQVSYRVIFYAK